MSANIDVQWLSELSAFKKLYIGYSGGVDSTVLLHSLATHPKLKAKTHAVHINHQLQNEANDWQRHCESVCQKLAIPLQCFQVTIDKDNDQSLEERARDMRHLCFSSLIKSDEALVLGHHQQDQVETLLLRLLKGSSPEGLQCMKTVSRFQHYTILRPLLNTTKAELITYATHHGLYWVEDMSNQDLRFDRNYIRYQLLPNLRKRFPGLDNCLTRTTHLCQEQHKIVEDLIDEYYPLCLDAEKRLNIDTLQTYSKPTQIQIVRRWIKSHHIPYPNKKKLDTLFKTFFSAAIDKHPSLTWQQYKITRYKNHLILSMASINQLSNMPCAIKWEDINTSLALPFDNMHLQLTPTKDKPTLYISPNSRVEVRFRQGGEAIYLHRHTRQLKKLFQQWSVPPWLRKEIPLIYIDGELAVVVDYCVSSNFDHIRHKSDIGYHLEKIA